jgi:SAM-dependent methyltransferase
MIEAFMVRYGVRGLARLRCRFLGVPDIGMFSRMSYFLRLSGRFGFEKLIRGNPRARILDAGCGDGLYSLYLARTCPHASIEACDTSQEAIAGNRETAAGMVLDNVSFSVRDLLSINERACYDLVLCIAVLVYRSHEENRRMLENICGSLKEGGMGYVFLTHKDWVSSRVLPARLYRRMYETFCAQNCGRMYGPADFAVLLKQTGFEIVHERVVTGFWGQLAWEIDKVCKEHGLERWKFLILPALKAMALADMYVRNRKGTGMVFVVRKSVRKETG